MSKDNPTKPPESPALYVFEPEKSRGRFREWFPQLPDAAVGNLVTYLSELNKFNKAVNLVSPQTLPVADAVHLADAVFALNLIRPEIQRGSPTYDLGSGNGIPGLAMALVEPSLQFISVDRDERKLEFCKHVAAACGAKNYSVLKAEVESLPKHTVVNAVARGFAPLPKALLMTRSIVAKGGRFFHLKGDQFAAELAQVPSQLFTYWQPRLLGEYRLPERGAVMSVVSTDKVAE